jgi:AraC-like DNA-binding protein
MNVLKNRKGKVDFRLQRMGNIYDQAKGGTDVPHRHDYYTVLLVEQAEGFHVIDYSKFLFSALEVHFVSPGQVHQVALDKKPRGSVMTFTRSFLLKNSIPENFISNINLFQNFGETPPLKIDQKTFERLDKIIGEMETCLTDDLKYGSRATGALLQLFLIYCNNSTELNSSQLDEKNAGICILRDFKKLVEEKYDEWHKVKSYASELHISAKHLSQTVKDLTGKVAKEYIQNRLVLESKRLLLHSNLAVKEIAYEIGFEDPLHFSSFFKKQVGISPSQFREKEE